MTGGGPVERGAGNIRADSEEIATTVALLRGQTQDQSVLLEAQRRSVLGLEKQMKSVQEAISVFDRYRQQTNQQLVDMQRQLQRPAGTP